MEETVRKCVCGKGRREASLGLSLFAPVGARDLRSRRVATSRFSHCASSQADKKRCRNKCLPIYQTKKSLSISAEEEAWGGVSA